MRIGRHFTKDGESAYQGIAFRAAASEIHNPDGSVVFHLEDFEAPEHWSQVATDIIAQKYFRKAGVAAKLKAIEEDDVPAWLWHGVYASDIPHAHRIPNSARYVLDRADLGEAAKGRILWEGTARLYGFESPLSVAAQ